MPRAGASDSLRKLCGLPRGRTTVHDLYVVPALAEFLAKNPRLRVDLVGSERPVDLVDERLDLAIRLAMDPDPGLIVRRIGSGQVVVCAAPDFLASNGRPSHPRDIGSYHA